MVTAVVMAATIPWGESRDSVVGSVREGRLRGGGDGRGGGLVMGSRGRCAGEAARGGIVVAGVCWEGIVGEFVVECRGLW